MSFEPDTSRSFGYRWTRPELQLIHNSTFPYGSNDGAVWAGRGLTSAAQAGVVARYGLASLVLRPQLIWSQNRSFELMPNGFDGERRFASGSHPEYIDAPQRFGDEPYTQLVLGQSSLRMDARGVAVGVSTANQRWGPADEFPIILGNNAAGFAHVFVESTRPVNIYLGRVHARLMWGGLGQSRYSPKPVVGDTSRRFTSGIAAVFLPAGVPGLELGASRFFHTPWPRSVLQGRYLLQPFEGFLKYRIPDERPGDPDTVVGVGNQLASVFARWAFPASGLEVYGEFGREDHNYDVRDLVLQPDHDSAYLLGIRKVWSPSPDRLIALHGEVVNAQISHLAYVRNPTQFYVHGKTRQGHTHRGQVLGSPAVLGGAGSVIGIDGYLPTGQWAVSWRREIRQEKNDYLDPVRGVVRSGWSMSRPDALDVVHSLQVEGTIFRRGLEVNVGVVGAREFARDFGDGATNLNTYLKLRWTL